MHLSADPMTAGVGRRKAADPAILRVRAAAPHASRVRFCRGSARGLADAVARRSSTGCLVWDISGVDDVAVPT